MAAGIGSGRLSARQIRPPNWRGDVARLIAAKRPGFSNSPLKSSEVLRMEARVEMLDQAW